ncbi:MAG: TonB-dependent receptor plug domain-containing protein [Gemmatimonas sp.]|nr:TonB-dependent receptor plug domain-containing protein [Gemmatimonas sp.]
MTVPGIQCSKFTLVAAGLVAVLGTTSVAAQTGTVTGRVTDAQSLQPLGAAQVSISDLGIGALTQLNGRFILINVPAGTHTVSVQRIGYGSAEATVTVTADESVSQDLAITEEALALDEVIVTGTPGGTRRRAIGNAVTRLDAAEVVEARPIQTMQDILQGRSPGVAFGRSSGNVGEGSFMRIRGVSSFELGAQPLIYVDGIRMDNSIELGPSTPNLMQTSGASALDDLNPNDIETIEIIKGPAAATLYGTEASAGVIQIITKKGQAGAPQFELGVTQGSAFYMDPAGMIGDQWTCASRLPCPESDLIRFNILEAAEARGEKPLGTGYNQSYALSVRGGSDIVNYFVSTDWNDQTGVVDYNWSKRFSGRANLGILMSDEINLNVSLGYISGDTRFASGSLEGGGFWPHLMWASGRDMDGEQRGYVSVRPEEFATVETTRDNTRFLGSVTLTHNPFDWLQHRFIVGIDRADEVDQILFPRDANRPFGALSEGEVTLTRPLNTIYTFDYSASAVYGLNDAISLTSSVGLQYFSEERNEVSTIGRVFPASSIRSLEGATSKVSDQEFEQNKSLGLFVQQELSWNDRIFLTGAVRGDDNSAFGADYDAAIYPKLSATWVASEESFWNSDLFSSFRLRAAWGKAGRQPGTFDAVTLFSPAVGSGGLPSIQPDSYGNPDLGPEVSTELELGFDAGFFNDRVSAEFTYYSQKIEDALVDVPLSPTSGFPGNERANLGRLDNHGYELAVNARALESTGVDFDLGFSLAYTMNEIKDLGGRAATNSLRLGFPHPNRTTDYIVGLEDGGLLCDAGVSLAPDPDLADIYGYESGGATVPCDQTEDYEVLLGPAFSPWTWTTDATLTLFNNLQIFGMVDAEHGRWINDYNTTCRTTACGFPNTRESLTLDDPIYVESVLRAGDHPNDDRYRSDSDASYIRLRELGARYTLPSRFNLGVDRATLTVAARNLWYLWTKQETLLDGYTKIPTPETSDPTSDDGFSLFQWPALTSFELGLRVAF